MKLEFIKDIGAGYPEDNIIRLFDFNCEEARLLKETLETELIQKHKQIALHDLTFINCINCKLTLTIGESTGIVQMDSSNLFNCSLTLNEYKIMADLINPFCTRLTGFQWLFDFYCETDLLLSPSGQW